MFIKEFGLSYNEVMYKIPYETLMMMHYSSNNNAPSEGTEPQQQQKQNKKTAMITEDKHGFPQLNLL